MDGADNYLQRRGIKATVHPTLSRGLDMLISRIFVSSQLAFRRWRRSHARLAAITSLVLAAGCAVPRTPGRVEAAPGAGALVLTPAAPAPGQSVAARYTVQAPFSGQRRLVLRARLRAPSAPAYNASLPIATLAVLRRTAPGTFAVSFSLPDSVVFATLVVEDGAGDAVDDNGGRAWELLVAAPTGAPLLAALEQRANDLMGRNWEEGFATARRMVELYPDSVRAWNWLKSFQSWLGVGNDDSVLAMHRSRLAELDARLARSPSPPAEEMGWMAWYALGLDSAVAGRWRARLLAEAPGNSFAVQWRLIEVLQRLWKSRDTVAALRALDALYGEAPPDRAGQVANYAVAVAFGTGDPRLVRLWTDRQIATAPDPRDAARWVASRLAALPAFRREGLQRLRSVLAALDTLPSSERRLGETARGQRERHAVARREALASLGRALVAAGENAAGLDTLALAAATGWDLDAFRAVYAATLRVGDTAAALVMAARIAVDPLTPPAFADSVQPLVARRMGAGEWRARLDTARGELVSRIFASAKPRSLPGSVRVLDLQGATHEVRDVAGGSETAVFFWSRFCGPAVQALPQMDSIASRLAREGIRVVSVAEETAPSGELSAFLHEKHVGMPVYLDAWHEASRAFNQWGTPYYYLMDAEGRIAFDVTTSLNTLLVRAEALRLRSARSKL